MNKKTIVALATSPLKGPISVIRVSGPNTFQIINKISKSKVTKKGNVIDYNFIVNDKKEIIDEVLLMKFVAPNSFTGEDVIEINCHGSTFVINKIIELVVLHGAKLAKKGEFTYQAFLNNKLDITKAESINDLVNSQNEVQHKLSINFFTGKTQELIMKLIGDTAFVLGLCEVSIDYPEYDEGKNTTSDTIKKHILDLSNKIETILDNSTKTKMIFDGIKTVIIGKPNVGKSTLLNQLLKEEKAIVTNIAGTTRDIVEGKVLINNVLLNLIDTAGIRNTKNKIETLGINKSKQMIEKADLVLAVFDGSKKLTKEDEEILNLIKNKTAIKVLNKSDIKQAVQITDSINISAKNNEIEKLIKKIEKLFKLDQIDYSKFDTLGNERQIILMKKVAKKLNDIVKSLNNEYIELVTNDLTEILDLLNEIIGASASEDVYEIIFSKFCLGK